MKATKKVLTLSLATLLAFSLASCGEEKRNQETPYGSINPSSFVLKSGDYSITEKELYNRLRYNNGYQAFKDKLDTIIYADEIEEFKDNYATNKDYQEKINRKLAQDLYSTVSPKDISVKLKNESKTHSLEISRTKYIDNMANLGIKLTHADLALNELDLDAEYVTFKNIPAELVSYYSKDIVKANANRNYLNSIVDKETIEKDGSTEKNPNYFDPEKNFESSYNGSYKNYNTSRGVILRFNNYSEAMSALNKALGSNTLTDQNARTVYTSLFNDYYNYEEATTDISNSKRAKFVTNKDKSELRAFSDQVETVFIEELTNEGVTKDGKKWYLDAPVNIDGKYYLIYKIDTVFDVYNVENPVASMDKSQKLDFDKLKDEANKAYYDRALAEAKKSFIEEKISSVETDLYKEELDKLELKIYDPYIENQFLNNYTEYDFVTSFNNDYIFEGKNPEVSYKVDDFYKDIQKKNLNSTATNLLLNKILYNTEADYLAKDEEKDLRKSIKDDVKRFKDGKAGLNKAYGEENYLFYSYGYSSENEIVTNKLGESIKNKYLNDFIYDSFITDNHEINTENLQIFKQIRDTALAIFNETDPDKKLYDFNMNIDHILISIDTNGDGKPDDLMQFLDKLSEAEKESFEEAVLKLAKEIANEVKHIDGHPTFEKLQYIVEAFDNNYDTYSGANWADFKTYKFSLKAESLGDVDEDKVNDYVPEFKDYVIKLFTKAVEEKLEIAEKDEKLGQLYFTGTGITPDNFGYADLCATTFGYHMISLNSYDDNSQELSFTLTDKDYENIKVILDENDTDTKDDDTYVTADLFNYANEEYDSNTRYNEKYDAKIPSLNQVFIYYVEYVNGSVHSIKTSLKNDLSKLLDSSINKFKSSGFQTYLLVKTLEDTLEVDKNLQAYSYQNYLEELKRKSEDYKLDSAYAGWYDLAWTR